MKLLFFLLLLSFSSIISLNYAYAELSISDDSTGGDCTKIGTWNSASKTCTLTKDVTEKIIINGNNIILDGNFHLLDTSALPGYSISSTKNNIIIKNFMIKGEEGIELQSTIGSKISNNDLTGSYKQYDYGDHGISISAKDSIIENNIINKFRTGLRLGGNCSGDDCNNIQDNNLIDGNKIFAIVPTEGVGIQSVSSGTIIKNNFAERTIEIARKDNKIFNNDIFIIDVSVPSGENYGSSWNNNIRKDLHSYVPENSDWWINGGGKMKLNTFPDVGNYYTSYDSPTEGCSDSNYDNICDTEFGSDEYPWNIPNGWLIKITTKGDIFKEAQSQKGATVNFSASATNNGNLTSVSCNPSSNTMFPMGNTTVVCTTPENRVTSFKVTVQDKTPPTIVVPSNLKLDAVTGKGTIVDYGKVTATDSVDLNVAVSCTPQTNSLFPIGKNSVDCSATDKYGNTSKKSFIVNIVTDVPLPIVKVPDDIIVNAKAEDGSYVKFPQITATDPSDLGLKGDPICDHPSGDFFNNGKTIVTCTVENNKDFPGKGTFSITVNPFIPPPMVVDIFLPTNNDLENGYKITDNRGDRSYTGSGVYVQGFEKTYSRSEGYGDSEVISVTVWMVMEDTPFQTSDEIAVEERDRNFGNAQTQTQVGYKKFTPLFFPSECKGIVEDFSIQQKIQIHCVKNNLFIRVGGLGGLWDLDSDVMDITNAILKKIEPDYVKQVISSLPKTENIPEPKANIESKTEKIPDWVKNNAKWWSEDQINDHTFVSGIQFLIQEKIVNISNLPDQTSESVNQKPRAPFVDVSKDPQHYVDRYNNEPKYKKWFDDSYPGYTIEEAVGAPAPIPKWIKNNANWWEQGLITEDEFIKGIEYLVENRILKVN